MTVQQERTKIGKVIVGDQQFEVVYFDNPSSQSLLKQMPFTIRFEDFAGKEKIFHPKEALSQKNAPVGADSTPGDIMCYGPWGNIAIFYRAAPYARGLIPLGRIDHVDKFIETLSLNHSTATFKKE